MIDISRNTAGQGGIHDPIVIQAEHVDAAVLRLVPLLPDVGQLAADNLADVLDNHLALVEVAGRVESKTYVIIKCVVINIFLILRIFSNCTWRISFLSKTKLMN